ncbi:MAG: hypothetical protein ACRDIY_01165 [Chloroflexota bacterium]
MKYIVNFFAFWYDFVVGDDWTVAVGVIVTLAIAAALARANLAAWWWIPLAIVVLLTTSLIRASRPAPR